MIGKTIFQILRTLDLMSRPQGTTKKEISLCLNISPRSAYRIIERLEAYGFPVYDENASSGKEKIWRVIPDGLHHINNFSIPDLKFSYAELVALYFLKSQAGLFDGTEIERYVKSAFQKVSTYIPQKAETHISALRKVFITKETYQKSYIGKEDIIETLFNAMANNESCRVAYHVFRDDEIRIMEIDPLHFFKSRGGLYALVRKRRQTDYRTLAVERFQNVEPMGQKFEYPRDFDPVSFINRPFGLIRGPEIHVKLWFSPSQARYIMERTWCENQVITDLNDGGILFEMTTFGQEDVKRWVMSFGIHSRVIEPETLKDEVVLELKKVMEGYLK
ncbi:transcriptional regulator, putative [Desulforapulum autotrophicum HRM2]|uniref:Transcriptional regulator, putative n=1 Tax=Desulforapulum autotrophicum (strain ATCC 43914 / DSM 3382 / VKM B-1955 / HRM2) TaxID=177437 RepID=C0QHV0_DESAH|nr:WYL domain-containing protein [Desulforapulum autotrophicum]ACN13658.1 transcriptional regulator, putative [Desulforapulum autotrophicum HRM2]